MRKQPDVLKHVADAPAQLCGIACVNGLALDAHHAAVRLDEAVDEFQRGRFAGARRANERDQLASLDIERCLRDRKRAPAVEGLAHFIDLNERSHCPITLRSLFQLPHTV
jgi:hypothetical protein